MSNNPNIPNDNDSNLESGTPANETRAQCLSRCQGEYNVCIVNPNPGETPAQTYARCQAALTACTNACPVKCD